MDPDMTLVEIRHLISMSEEEGEDHYEEIAAMFGALDKWLSSGGFLPRAWVDVSEL